MKAISLWQPWASLMAVQVKKIETRSRRFSYRGPLLIHAAKRPVDVFDKAMWEALWPHYQKIADLPYGALVGLCNLYRVRPIFDAPITEISADELSFGDYSVGRHMLMTENMRRFAEPIPYKGNQGYPFNVLEPEVLERIKHELSKLLICCGCGKVIERSNIPGPPDPPPHSCGNPDCEMKRIRMSRRITGVA